LNVLYLCLSCARELHFVCKCSLSVITFLTKTRESPSFNGNSVVRIIHCHTVRHSTPSGKLQYSCAYVKCSFTQATILSLHVSYSRLQHFTLSCIASRRDRDRALLLGNEFQNMHCLLTGTVHATSWPLKVGSIGCFETSVRNYHSTLNKIPKQRKSLWNRRLPSS
jgi:hypothetical protein